MKWNYNCKMIWNIHQNESTVYNLIAGFKKRISFSVSILHTMGTEGWCPDGWLFWFLDAWPICFNASQPVGCNLFGVTHLVYQIFILLFITVDQLQLWSSSELILRLGVTKNEVGSHFIHLFCSLSQECRDVYHWVFWYTGMVTFSTDT